MRYRGRARLFAQAPMPRVRVVRPGAFSSARPLRMRVDPWARFVGTRGAVKPIPAGAPRSYCGGAGGERWSAHDTQGMEPR
jgi:hypothetical protein